MDWNSTPSQTVGPFFHIGLTNKHSAPRVASPKAKGEHIRLSLRVIDGEGAGIPDAMLEIWQADAQGKYNHPDDMQDKTADPECHGFGRMAVADDGSCEFETVRPGRVPGPGGVLQAPHLNLAVFGRGMLKQFYTRIYFAGDPANAECPVLALVPAERRETLMAKPDPARPGSWRFDLRLQGDGETVFFDV